MARKRKKHQKAASGHQPKPAPQNVASQKTQSRLQSIPRRTWILSAVGAVVAVGGASALHAWDVRSRTLHDLGVIGEGTPVVVQVHDRSCGICRRLKSSATAALSDRSDIQYRIADISKSDGRELQERYNLPKTSLLFFDASGQRVHSHTGLLDADEVTTMVDEVLRQLNERAS